MNSIKKSFLLMSIIFCFLFPMLCSRCTDFSIKEGSNSNSEKIYSDSEFIKSIEDKITYNNDYSIRYFDDKKDNDFLWSIMIKKNIEDVAPTIYIQEFENDEMVIFCPDVNDKRYMNKKYIVYRSDDSDRNINSEYRNKFINFLKDRSITEKEFLDYTYQVKHS